MTFKSVITLAFLIALASCNLQQKAKDGINAAGQAGGEAIKQVSQGVQDAFKLKVQVDAALLQTISTGETKLSNSNNGTDNVLQWYVIFNTNVKKEITAKVFNQSNQEKGRVKITLEGKKDDARFVDLIFDNRVNIDATDTVVIN
jgi:hypothetical protein